jgi:molybdopterin converting factor small subunit
MKIIYDDRKEELELPFKLLISFKDVFSFFMKYTEDKRHPYYQSAVQITSQLKKFPELIEGFSDFSLLEKYKNEIDLMLEPLFPEALTNNEIKTVSIPFSYTTFKFTNRFKNILKNAGDDFQLKFRSMQEDEMYISACTMILGFYYKQEVDLRRSFFFDIPNKKTGINHHYRVAYNADFANILPTESAPKITEEDIKLLLDNFDDIALWKEKFPPNSYVFKGFGLMNLFDVTADENLSSIKENMLRRDDDALENIQTNIREFFRNNDLKIGFSAYNLRGGMINTVLSKNLGSIIVDADEDVDCHNFFCHNLEKLLFENNESIVISDVEKYGKATNKNQFYKSLKKHNIGSIILIPLRGKGGFFALLEIASPRAYELNSVNKNKLKDIIPVFETAVIRASEEHMNLLEATIQEHYTSIHPSVKWRFYEAAEDYLMKLSQEEEPAIDSIVFNDVYPLYGQCDIKGSSLARNQAITEDLVEQLTMVINILSKASKKEILPIYSELMFRVNQYLNDLNTGLKTGDEVAIIEFSKNEIYPVFKHVKAVNRELKQMVESYMSKIDPQLQVIYNHRKAYEKSVNLLNKKLAKYLDSRQEEAQKMFPHYYERYKTDGLEFNLYIGDSLVKDRTFEELYLYNLRLWQLQVICEMENIAYKLKKSMDHGLDVASLILVHSNPMAIKFRMDEKRFDVDGAYNIRYEIIKKRIDKALIKGTNKRLTTPGKIAIVYSQDKDAKEYMKYIKYLQSQKMLGKVEDVMLEDLQGASGLKALRVEVLYKDAFNEKDTVIFQEIMQQLNN